MEITKDLEEKGSEIGNPSGYLRAAVKRELGDASGGREGGGKSGSGVSGGTRVNSGIHKRCTWLNGNVFGEGAITEEAMLAISGMSNAMDLLKEIEDKHPDVNNPSGYLLAAAKRQHARGDNNRGGSRPGGGGGGGGDSIDSGVHKRCTWLNNNVFAPGAIDEEAIAALSTLDFGKAMEITKEMEEKAPTIKSPTNYLLSAVRRERAESRGSAAGRSGGGGASSSSGAVDSGVHKRCTWLNANVFGPDAIDEDAIAALSSIDFGHAMEITKEMEQKGPDAIQNPTGYILAAVKRAHGQEAKPRRAGGAGGGGGGAAQGVVDSKVHRRCTWLAANVFGEGSIDDDAIAALSRLDFGEAMEITKDMEEKGPSEIRNPTGYLKAAVTRHQQGGNSRVGAQGGGSRGGAQVIEVDAGVHKRCTWLNTNVFGQGAIDDYSMAGLTSGMTYGRAMEFLKEMEEKGPDQIKNASAYIKAAVKREGGTPGGASGSRASSPSGGGRGGPAEVSDGVRKRCAWLNANVFGEGAIDEGAMASLSAIDRAEAMEICRHLEDKGSQISNPSGYLRAAAAKGSLGSGRGGGAGNQALATRQPARGGGAGNQAPQPRAAPKGRAEPRRADSGVHKRCTWLNGNVFGQGAIDESAMTALSGIQFGRAMDICKELEEKGADKVANPSAYLKAAARRESQGGSDRTASRGPKQRKGKGAGKTGSPLTALAVLPKLKLET